MPKGRGAFSLIANVRIKVFMCSCVVKKSLQRYANSPQVLCMLSLTLDQDLAQVGYTECDAQEKVSFTHARAQILRRELIARCNPPCSTLLSGPTVACRKCSGTRCKRQKSPYNTTFKCDYIRNIDFFRHLLHSTATCNERSRVVAFFLASPVRILDSA